MSTDIEYCQGMLAAELLRQKDALKVISTVLLAHGVLQDHLPQSMVTYDALLHRVQAAVFKYPVDHSAVQGLAQTCMTTNHGGPLAAATHALYELVMFGANRANHWYYQVQRAQQGLKISRIYTNQTGVINV